MKAADLDKVDYHRIMEIASERFSNAADFTFTITGAFTIDEIRPLIEQYIASLPGKGKTEKAVEVLSFAPGKQEVVFGKKMEVPMAVVLYMETGKGKWDLKNSLTMDIAHQILNIIYTEEIREKEGGTYGVSTNGGYNVNPETTDEFLQIVYQTSPEDYTRLNKRIEELLADFAQNGPSAANLQKVKDYMHKTHEENLRDNYFWANVLREYLKYDVDSITGYDEVLKSITADEVSAAIEHILKQGNETKVVMYGVTE